MSLATTYKPLYTIVDVIKKLTFRNRCTIVLLLHSLQITIAIVLKNESDRSH